MNRVEKLDCFRIYGEEDIDSFISVFLHARNNLSETAIKIDQLKEDLEEYSKTHSEEEIKEKSKEITAWTKIQPHEKKTSDILKRLLERILDKCYNKGGICVYFSEHYNDRYYRDIYSMYYSAKHFSLPNICSRFFLFDISLMQKMEDENKDIGHAFIGSIVRRPLRGREIGRTLINPAWLFDANLFAELKCNIWRNKYKMTMYGVPLELWAFPYTMQDGEIATCAETTIMNIVDYYSQRYAEYRTVLPSTISQIVRKHSNSRNLPSTGLTYEMVSKVFMELGFSPILYSAKIFKNRFAQLLHSYVASGIPVALGLDEREGGGKGHSVIVIGTQHRLIDADSEKRKRAFEESPILRLPNKATGVTHYQVLKSALDNLYIVMDDGRDPYSCAEIFEKEGSVYLRYNQPIDEWKVSIFVVPLSAEMLMDAEAAITCFRSILKDENFGYSGYIMRLSGLSEEDKKQYSAGLERENPLLTRIFLCPSKRLKEQRIREYELDSDWESLDAFQKVHLPRFVWVCELYTRDSYTGTDAYCVGEIILDATNAVSPNDDIDDVIWIKYPWKQAYRCPDQSIMDLERQMFDTVDSHNKTWIPITPFRFELH